MRKLPRARYSGSWSASTHCCLTLGKVISPLSADPTKVVDLKFPPKIEAGKQYSASVVLDAPAPAGGSKVILLPTHRIEYQDTLIVPEGKTEAEFTFDVFKAQIAFDDGSGSAITKMSASWQRAQSELLVAVELTYLDQDMILCTLAALDDARVVLERRRDEESE